MWLTLGRQQWVFRVFVLCGIVCMRAAVNVKSILLASIKQVLYFLVPTHC